MARILVGIILFAMGLFAGPYVKSQMQRKPQAKVAVQKGQAKPKLKRDVQNIAKESPVKVATAVAPEKTVQESKPVETKAPSMTLAAKPTQKVAPAMPAKQTTARVAKAKTKHPDYYLDMKYEDLSPDLR